MKEFWETVILGAGASGMMVAASLREEERSLLLESNPRPGAKIAVSGGGRCNLGNLHLDSARYRGDASFVREVFARYDQKWLREWFERRGVATRVEKGSQLFCRDGASAAVDALRRASQKSALYTGWKVESFRREREGFALTRQGGGMVHCRRLVVASG
ncbi:NAD(P)/FAD-dependent oxidoreductase, partial [Nitratifractor sp.]